MHARRRLNSLARVAAVFALLLGAPSFGQAAPSPLRVLLPASKSAAQFDKEMTAIVEEYNRQNPQNTVELIRRGAEFSALKELVAAHFSGTLPALAAIEAAELPALEGLGLAKPIPPDLAALVSKNHFHILNPSSHGSIPKSAPPISLPMTRSTPVLLLDQEMLFRIRANPDQLPKTWDEILTLAQRLAQVQSSTSEFPSLAIPLQGERGLWIFEALANRPLWTREAGGLKANRALLESVAQLHRWVDTLGSKVLRLDESWERSIQNFVDRKTPLLVATLDQMPWIASQTGFRWSATLLPSFGGTSSSTVPSLVSGSDWVLLQDSPAARSFLKYLYSPAVAARWTAAGSLIPIRPEIADHPEWKRRAQSLGHYPKVATRISKTRLRSQDREMVRARTAWIQSLPLWFGPSSRRPAAEILFGQLDRQMNGKIPSTRD